MTQAFDDVIISTFKPNIAVFILNCEVATDKPIPPENSFFFFGLLPITQHKTGIQTMNGQ